MNIRNAADRLLSYFSPEERSVPDSVTYPGRNAAVMAAMNSGLQDLFGKGKPWVRNDERGIVLHAPTAVTIAVTNGSTAGTVTGWAAWMAGCTIVIAGEENDNQIRNAASVVRLKYPYAGTSGTKTATVYQDSFSLDADVLEVHEPIRLDRMPLLSVAGSRFPTSRITEDFGFAHSAIQVARVGSTAARPSAYSVETWSPDNVTAPVTRIRLYPAPSAAGSVDYKVMLLPPIITDISSTAALPIPYQFMESIFLPIATKKLRVCPFWRATMNDQQVEDDYKNALALLSEGSPDKITPIRFGTAF